MLRRDGDEPLHVRRGVKRWRHDAFGGGLTDLPHEPLEQKRLEADQGFASIGRFCDERVGHPLGTERKRTGRQAQPSITDIDGEHTIDDVEPLIFIGMDVPGRAVARPRDDLDQTELPGSVLSTDLKRFQHAQDPEGLAFLRAQPISELCSFCRNFRHEALLFSVGT
jgi:hypothetical protein